MQVKHFISFANQQLLKPVQENISILSGKKISPRIVLQSGKNKSDQTYSCPRDLHFLASWEPN